MGADPHVLAERLNTEPPVSRGCSVPEILTILLTAVGVCLPVGGVLGWWFGAFQLGLAAGVVGIVTALAVVPTGLQRIKRDRPPGYPQQWVAVRLHDLGIWPSVYIRKHGTWDLGRTLK
jgi:conjugative transfer region protein (TIGR03750 family)